MPAKATNRIVDDSWGDVEWPVVAVLRRCHPQLARRKPAIERGQTRPLLAKLDDDLERPLMAEWVRSPTAAQWHFSSQSLDGALTDRSWESYLTGVGRERHFWELGGGNHD